MLDIILVAAAMYVCPGEVYLSELADVVPGDVSRS